MDYKFNFGRNRFFLFILIFIFVFLFGIASSEYLAHFGEERERRSLLQLTATATAAIDATQVSLLKGTPDEAESTAYRILKKQVELLHTHIPEAGFIYIMKRKRDRVVWLADSEPADSKDAVLPGEPYDEASEKFIQAFKTGESITEGPIKDKWGVWVSGHTAIHHPETQSVIALLGIDIRANHWERTILSYRLLGYALTLSLLFLTFVFYIYTGKMHKANQVILQEITIRQKAENEVKELGSLLPICSSCKKIRDDKGYWNQLESYIENHFDASFSHGMCGQCSDRLYGEEEWYKDMKGSRKDL